MAYSMFECPKLYNVKSLKYFPEPCDHHVSFRHKNLPSDFQLTSAKCKLHPKIDSNYSMQPQSSQQKCPIYVHDFTYRNEGDVRKSKKSKHKAVIERLEESYWANWKPQRKDILRVLPTVPVKKPPPPPEIKVIKSAPIRSKKIKIASVGTDSFKDEVRCEEKQVEVVTVKKSQQIQTDEEVKNDEEPAAEVKEETETFLKHTDSFIINVKKQKEEKEHFEQPKCIRLYKKPAKICSKNVVKGGSYPLKSCLKKDSTFSRTSSKLARPGSPVITSSSFSSRTKYSKSRK